MNFSGSGQVFSPELLTDMSALLQHRGPDDAGVWVRDGVGLAHRRLSVIDLSSAGHQPMVNDDESVVLSYNGEIYNFQELKLQYGLGSKYSFRSRTDSEVLLRLYEDMGIDCLDRLNGMFAFAIWDSRSRSVHLARDAFGIKPLFYTVADGTLWFASEIKPLLLIPGLSPTPSLEALHHFLSFDYVPGDLTAFEGIRELRPGHRLEMKQGDSEPRIRRFYDIEFDPDPSLSMSDCIQGSKEFLKKAIERQLVADVPVGVMLSGGMDSSALVALMAEIRGDSDFHTFSLGFDSASFDESSDARIVADRVGTKHHEIRVTPDLVRDLLPKYLCHIDEPYADGSAIPTYLLAERAKQHVTVLLSGEAGDECFSGYDTHPAHLVRGLYRKVPRFIRQGLVKPIVNLLPVSHKKLSFEFKAKRFVEGAELSIPSSHHFWRVVLSEDAKRLVLDRPERFSAFGDSNRFFVDAYNDCTAEDDLNRLLYIDFNCHLPDDLMIKNDRMTMAHSLEARVPFTDNELVEFMGRVPVEYKMKGLTPKHLLRTAMRPYLPDVITEKKKVGLEMPYSQWMNGELRELTDDVLSSSHLTRTGLFNAEGVQRMLAEHRSMAADHGRALWGLLNYMLWHRVYIEERSFASYLDPPRQAIAT